MGRVRADGIVEALRCQVDRTVRSWIDQYEASPFRWPGPIDREGLTRWSRPVVEALAVACQPAEGEVDVDLTPGSRSLRELERCCSFFGATLAGSGATSFDASALAIGLREVVARQARDHRDGRALARVVDWIGALIADGFATSLRDGARERHGEILANGMPVCLVRETVPAVFLIGDGVGAGVDNVLGRVLLLIARVGARQVIVDAHGLAEPRAPAVLEAFARFAAHEIVAGRVTSWVVGLCDADQSGWRDVGERGGSAIRFAEDLLQALGGMVE